MLQGAVVAHHTNGRRSARFGGDEDRIVGEKTATATTEGFEALLQTLGDEARHPKVEGRGDQSGGVARFGEFGREAVVDKIGHALGGRHLRAPTLHPRRALDALLQPHHAQGIRLIGEGGVAFGQGIVLQGFGHPRGEAVVKVFGTGFDHHARVGPATASVGGAHAVDHQLFGAGGGGNDKSTGAHAERIHTAPVHLLHKGVFGRREIVAAPFAVVILDLVDEVRRVLQTHAHGHGFLLDFDACGMEIAIDIAGGVAGGENHGAVPLAAVGGAHPFHPPAIGREEEGVDARLKMHFTARLDDLPTHAGDDAREAIGADVGMGVGENVGGGAVLAEDAEDARHVAALLGTSVELTVGEGPGPAFAEGIVALGIDTARTGDGGNVLLTAVDIASALEHHGAHAEFDESQGGKESCGACADHDGLRRLRDIAIANGGIGEFGGLFAHPNLHAEIDHHVALARVDAAAHNAHLRDLTGGDAEIFGHRTAQACRIVSHFRTHTELKSSRHIE